MIMPMFMHHTYVCSEWSASVKSYMHMQYAMQCSRTGIEQGRVHDACMCGSILKRIQVKRCGKGANANQVEVRSDRTRSGATRCRAAPRTKSHFVAILGAVARRRRAYFRYFVFVF